MAGLTFHRHTISPLAAHAIVGDRWVELQSGNTIYVSTCVHYLRIGMSSGVYFCEVDSAAPDTIVSILKFMGERPQLINERADLASLISHMRRMTPYEFEQFVMFVFASYGWHTEVTKGSGDDGIDGIMSRGQIKAVVQVKKYGRGTFVGPHEVRDFMGAMQHAGVDLGYFVTTSDFTPAARAYGSERVRLIYKDKFARWAAEALHRSNETHDERGFA